MATDVLETVPAAGRRPWRAVRRVGLVLVVFVVAGNALIMGATLWYRWRAHEPAAATAAQVDNLRVVDTKVWRGAAPDHQALRDLAAAGVTTIVDLRAESSVDDAAIFTELGLDRTRLPIRDGQLPTASQTSAFLDIVEHAPGIVFVHCGAGVGRTGSMAAYYLTATGSTSGPEALRRNLAVGPPSLEQIAFAAGLDNGAYDHPGAAVTAMSRVLDAPRRLWHNL